MIKTTMMSFCQTCKKSVGLYEEMVDKYVKEYYCGECKKYIRTITAPEK